MEKENNSIGWDSVKNSQAETLPMTVANLAEWKHLPVTLLESFGVKDGRFGNKPCVDIPYLDKQGDPVNTQKRTGYKVNRFQWPKGSKAKILYGLHQVPTMHASGANYVLIVEGTSDVWTLTHASTPAVGVAGTNVWSPESAQQLADFQYHYAWKEHGDAASDFVKRIAKDIPGLLVITAPDDADDPSELWELCQGNPEPLKTFQGRMINLINNAVPYKQILEAENKARIELLTTDCQVLLDAPNIVDALREAINSTGYAGDSRPAIVAHQCMLTRLYRAPASLGYISESASGKTFAIDTAKRFFPAYSYYELKASSERALIYNNEDFKHRVVIYTEADSLPENGSAGSALRSLIDAGAMEYETVGKDENGNQVSRRIVKEGPTVLLTTSTKILGAQSNTRLLTMTIPDTNEQTKLILESQANAFEGKGLAVDYAPWIALHEYLEMILPGVDVIVPFSRMLASYIPTGTVAMRRGFPQLNVMIISFAMLRQHQRQRDDEGRIIATLEDYAEARDLLRETFATKASGGVTPAIRETVNKIRELMNDKPESAKFVSERDLATALDLARQTIQYRVNNAIRLGLVINSADKNKPKVLSAPSELDDDIELPTVETLRNALSLGNDWAIGQPLINGAKSGGSEVPNERWAVGEVQNDDDLVLARLTSDESAEQPKQIPGAYVVNYEVGEVEGAW